MTELRGAHTVWLMRRAAILEGTAVDAGSEPLDPARANVLQRVASRIAKALERSEPVELTPTERTLLVTEAANLTERAARELRAAPRGELRRAEEWVSTARAIREVVEATRTPAS